MSSPHSPIPVGLVGAGKHGGRYLRHIGDDVPELRVALLCRRDTAAGERQASACGARFVADVRELVSSPAIEAVIAVVPPSLNVDICLLAAAAGKAVLVEKPLAVSVEAGRRIRAAVEGAGVPFMVAQTLRFNHVVACLRDHLATIAPVAQVCLSQRFEPSVLEWLDDPAVSGGGIILHTGVHSFDLLRLFAPTEPAWALAATTRVATRRTEDNFTALFGFRSPGVTATVAGSRSTAGRSGAIEISGERGQLVGDHVLGFAVRIEGSRRIDLVPSPVAPTVRETLRAFARALRSGEPMPIRLDDGLRAVAMAEACYRSAASGRREPIEI
ncbi:MAG: Gfo/Idh/MocA family protein [Candidatus Binatia bacterium]